ncbi:MAG: hypothetical protein QXX41_11815 [Nitrososphaerota archaeon]
MHSLGTPMFIYDPREDSWKAAASLPSPLYHVMAAATSGCLADEMICVFSSDPIPPVYGEWRAGYTYIYFPRNNSWIRAADMLTGRVYPGAAAYNDTIYVIGGFKPVISYLVKPSNVGERFQPPGFGRVTLRIRIISPINGTSYAGSVSLIFSVNRPVVWMGYSLDGQANITITGNTTLTGLSDGTHSLIVYATDTDGNTGASETVYFNIKTQQYESFPHVWVVAAALVTATSAATLIAYFTKIKRTTKKTNKPKHHLQTTDTSITTPSFINNYISPQYGLKIGEKLPK